MSSCLDCAFYTSFYNDVSSLTDSIAINEHYLNVGKSQGRVANETELHDLCSLLTHFDDNVYSTANLSYNLAKTLKDQWITTTTKKQWMSHYYGADGNLNSSNRLRIMNHNDLKYISNLWDNIYNKVFDVVKFNVLFYKTFYTIPSDITNLRDLQLFWLKHGMFMGQMSNLHSLTQQSNTIGAIQIVLIENFKLDISFIAKYKGVMIDYMNQHSLPMLQVADETVFLLYLFLNTGYKLRLFFNKNDMDESVKQRRKQYDDAIESIKNDTYKKMLEVNDASYDLKSISLMKLTPKNEFIPIVPNNFADIISVKNIVKLSNTTVVDCFMKLYKKDNLTDIVIIMILNELKNCLNFVVNSMELKILVSSVVYNVFIKDKSTSILYKGLVKEKSVEIINAIFKAHGLEDPESVAAIEQDVCFLIDNKKVIKLSYTSNVVTKIIVEAFLLTL